MKYLLILLCLSACAQPKSSSVTVQAQKSLNQSVWKLPEGVNPTDRTTSPFYGIVLAGTPFNQSSSIQVLPDTVSGCNTTAYMVGDDNSGVMTLITYDSGAGCSGFNNQTASYQRQSDLTMKFCINNICAIYQ